MITIKLSADNVRLLKGAKSEAEVRGALEMVLERLLQAESAKLFKAEPASKAASKKYNWRVAKEIMSRVLGDDLKAPPFPDPIWYQRVHRTLKQYDFNEEKLLELAEYAKTHLKPPYSMDFLICAHERILAGHFDSQSRRGANANTTYTISGWRENSKLPEE